MVALLKPLTSLVLAINWDYDGPESERWWTAYFEAQRLGCLPVELRKLNEQECTDPLAPTRVARLTHVVAQWPGWRTYGAGPALLQRIRKDCDHCEGRGRTAYIPEYGHCFLPGSDLTVECDVCDGAGYLLTPPG